MCEENEVGFKTIPCSTTQMKISILYNSLEVFNHFYS